MAGAHILAVPSSYPGRGMTPTLDRFSRPLRDLRVSVTDRTDRYSSERALELGRDAASEPPKVEMSYIGG
jgi:hypothetical protein